MFSVIMPCFNSEAFIRPAVESILKQTFRQFEFIIVDDGSTDKTVDLIKEYADKDDRIRFVTTGKQNSGSGGAARNLAVQYAKYDWLAMVDHDDVSLPHRLEIQALAIKENPDVIGWGGFVHHINGRGDILSLQKWGAKTKAEFTNMQMQGQPLFILHPTAVLRKDIFLRVGGYHQDFQGADDLDLFDRMSEYGLLLTIPKPLAFYRIHSASLTSQRFKRQTELTQYIGMRCKARLMERDYPDLSIFLDALKDRSIFNKIIDSRNSLSRYFYREFGLLVANQIYTKGLVLFFIALFLKPEYTLPRLWRQVLSLEARSSIKSLRQNEIGPL
jgi:glycosyltransferase involved in cell wall biosynthesis